MGIEARQVYYSGQVQGVGFRYSTLRLAQGYPDVHGYVQNLPDGRVEVVAEGSASDLKAFLNEISRVMGGYIRDVRSQVRPASRSFCGFTIK